MNVHKRMSNSKSFKDNTNKQFNNFAEYLKSVCQSVSFRRIFMKCMTALGKFETTWPCKDEQTTEKATIPNELSAR